MTDEEYFADVMRAGNRDPWKHLGRLNQKTEIQPDQVEMDAAGNITKMPLLENKPCFGRAETLLRHGERTRPFKTKFGTMVETTTQCGRCPSLTRRSCIKVVTHRVKANPAIHAALKEWQKYCDDHLGGARDYTGHVASEHWGAFKKAIAARGPFTSVNDDAVKEAEAERKAMQTAKWRVSKATYRDKLREKRRRARQLPSAQFVANARDERNRRIKALRDAMDDPMQPRCISKVPLAHRDRTAVLTANAAFVREILIEADRPAGPGVIARHLVELGLNEGVGVGTLKARMPNDLQRAYECEIRGIWSRFNPHSDLDEYAEPDDAAVDAYEAPITGIEAILDELAGLPVPAIAA
jgi:hypothetical protein